MAESFTRESVWKQTPNVVARKVRGEVLLVPIQTSSASLDSFYSLNKMAAEIWQALCEGKSIAEISRTIAAQYAVSRAEAEADILALAAELELLGALEYEQPID